MDRTSKPRPSVKKKAAQKDASRAAREQARLTREEERAARQQAAREEKQAVQEQAAREALKQTVAPVEPAEPREDCARDAFDAGETAVIAPLGSNAAQASRQAKGPHQNEDRRWSSQGQRQTEALRQPVQDSRRATGQSRWGSDSAFYEAEGGEAPSCQAARVNPSRYHGGESLDRFAQANGPAVGVNAAQSFKRKRNPFGIISRFLAALIAIAVLASVVVLGVLTIAEFRPRDTMPLEVANPVQPLVQSEQSLSILTWNIGYAGLPASATSYLDDGAGVRAESAQIVKANMSSMENVVADQNSDFTFLQEVDRVSDRSFKVNEEKAVSMSMEALGRSSAFAQDFKAPYVPHPWPFLGAVDSGSMTMSKYRVESAERISLPSAQSWPTSLFSPNACVLVEKLPIEGSSKKLVLMNVRFDDHATEEVHDAQANQLALLMKREADKGNYVIAGGDFDQNFSSTDVRAYGKEISRIRSTGVLDESVFAEGMQFEMDSSTPTMRSLNAPYEGDGSNIRFYVSDGFIVSSNIKVDGVTTIDEGFRNSDHNPVKLNVTLS